MATFDPFEQSNYKRMQRWARSCSYALGRDPTDGEDALQEVLMQISGGDDRPLRRGEISLKTCIRNRILTTRGTDQGHAIANTRLSSGGMIPGATAVSPFVALLGLACEEDLCELQLLVAPAFRELEEKYPHHARSYKARLRQQLLGAGGAEELAAFERWYEVDLGLLTGTNAIAEELGQPEGTAANHANRGERRLMEIIRGWWTEKRRIRDEGR